MADVCCLPGQASCCSGQLLLPIPACIGAQHLGSDSGVAGQMTCMMWCCRAQIRCGCCGRCGSRRASASSWTQRWWRPQPCQRCGTITAPYKLLQSLLVALYPNDQQHPYKTGLQEAAKAVGCSHCICWNLNDSRGAAMPQRATCSLAIVNMLSRLLCRLTPPRCVPGTAAGRPCASRRPPTATAPPPPFAQSSAQHIRLYTLYPTSESLWVQCCPKAGGVADRARFDLETLQPVATHYGIGKFWQ